MPPEPEPTQDTQICARFLFDKQQQALDFTKVVSARQGKLSVDYSAERERWQVTVRHQMQPLFQDITVWLATLTAQAATIGGDKDGWGKER